VTVFSRFRYSINSNLF